MSNPVRFTLLRSLSVGALLLLTAACDGETLLGSMAGPPTIRTARASVAPGEAMPLLLINDSPKEWEYGACSYAVERLDGATWVTALDTRFQPCAAVGYSLSSGGRTTVNIQTPATPGTHRVRFRFNHFPQDRVAHVEVTSNTYVVQ